MTEGGPEEFETIEQALAFYKEQCTILEGELREMTSTFDEFQAGSHELEQELEKEIGTKEAEISRLQGRMQVMSVECEEWKAKFREATHQHHKSTVALQTEIEFLRSKLETLRSKTRILEQDNDDLERAKRATSSSLQDLEATYHGVLERNAFLESELEIKADMAVDIQRLRDELRETKHELSLKRSKDMAQQTVASITATTPVESLPNAQGPTTRRFSKKSLGVWSDHSGMASSRRSPRHQSTVLNDMILKVKTLDSRLSACRSILSAVVRPPEKLLDRRNHSLRYDKPDLRCSSSQSTIDGVNGGPSGVSNTGETDKPREMEPIVKGMQGG